MKNKTITMLTVALATLFTSCAGTTITEEVTPVDERIKVNFTAGQSISATVTRVSGSTWELNDKIGVTMLNSECTTVIGSYSNYRYDASTSGTSVGFTKSTGDMWFPSGNVDVCFVAYYPYNSSYINTIPINTQTKNEDIMWAKESGNGFVDGKTVNLSFTHKLAKIVVKLVAGSNSPDLSTVQLNLETGYSTGSLDIKTGVITKSGSAVDYLGELTATGVSNEYAMFIIPQTMPSNSYINLSTNDGQVDIMTDGKTFEAGKQYTYTVTVNKNPLTLTGTTITAVTNESLSQTVEL